MTYEEWEENLHECIKNEPAWRFYAYRKALFVYDLVWQDCDRFSSDRKGRAIVDQIIRSAGSISANIEEGHGRGFGKEFGYFLRVAAGSARETKGWYWRGRQLLPENVLEHRLTLLDEIISLLVTEINRQKTFKKTTN
ncbi:MAG: four helix bundle protein [Chloroflexota bacterium]